MEEATVRKLAFFPQHLEPSLSQHLPPSQSRSGLSLAQGDAVPAVSGMEMTTNKYVLGDRWHPLLPSFSSVGTFSAGYVETS